MPKNGGKKNSSVKRSVNKEKQNKNADPALQNFSCYDGIVVDFQKLSNYQPPVAPIYDVRLIDRFNPNVAKCEYVMVKIDEEFHSMDYSVKRFTNISLKLVKIFSEIKNIWEISPDFVQKQVLGAYGSFPQITLQSSLYLNDPCMLDFITLTIAIKYAIILKKYKNHIREQILQKREPVLQKFLQEHNISSKCKGLQLYEWFLSLMQKYADNNDKLVSRSNVSDDDYDSSIPYILPFVGLGSPTEFYSAHAICRSPDYSHYDFKEDSDCPEKFPKTEGLIEDIDRKKMITVENEENALHEKLPECIDTEIDGDNVAVHHDQDSTVDSNSLPTNETTADSKNEENIKENAELAERFQREAVIMNDAFIRFIHNNFGRLSAEQLELANSVRSATVSSIKEMSSYLENEELNYSAEELGQDEWELLCQYVRICHKVLVGEEDCEEIEQATNKLELNNLRLSYLAHYEAQRLKEIKENMENKEKQSNRSENDLVYLQSIRETSGLDDNQECYSKKHMNDIEAFEEKKEEDDYKAEKMTEEEIRMMKLYMKTSRPGRSTDDPTWDYQDSDEDC